VREDTTFDLPRSRGAVSAWGSLRTFQHGDAVVSPTPSCRPGVLPSVPTAEELLLELGNELSVKQQADLESLPASALRQVYETQGPVALQLFFVMCLRLADVCRKWNLARPTPDRAVELFCRAVNPEVSTYLIPYFLSNTLWYLLRPATTQLPAEVAKGIRRDATLPSFDDTSFAEWLDLTQSLCEEIPPQGSAPQIASALPRLLRRSRFRWRFQTIWRRTVAMKARTRLLRAVRRCPRARRHTSSRWCSRAATADGDAGSDGGDGGPSSEVVLLASRCSPSLASLQSHPGRRARPDYPAAALAGTRQRDRDLCHHDRGGTARRLVG